MNLTCLTWCQAKLSKQGLQVTCLLRTLGKGAEALSSFIDNTFEQKKRQILADGPDWLLALPKQSQNEVVEALFRTEYVWPIVQPGGIIDDLASVERTKVLYERAADEKKKFANEAQTARDRVKESEIEIKKMKAEAIQQHGELTRQDEEKIAEDSKHLEELKEKLKASEDKEKASDKRLGETGAEVKEAEGARDQHFTQVFGSGMPPYSKTKLC
jgi:hypothetical protein